ncbi:MAG: hypothetical protein AAF465_12865 [Pseudomonadota bacterium]
MRPIHWIAAGLVLFAGVATTWSVLGWQADWPVVVIGVSLVPLIVSLACMATLQPKPFFYAALVLMLYVAFAITHIAVADERVMAGVVLGLALVYLAILKFVLQALNARLAERRASP